MITYNRTDTTLALFLDGKMHYLSVGSPEEKRVFVALQQNASENELRDAMLPPTEKEFEPETFDAEGFEIVTTEGGEYTISYGGEVLPKALQKKVESLWKHKLSLEPFARFWENLSENPSKTSIDQLITFLDNKELAFTEDGFFLAHKGVQSNGWSCHGNTSTKVLQGKVNSDGHIYNAVGETIEVRRRDVQDDPNVHCSFGLHAGAHAYSQSFGSKRLIVKINPKDVVSVPVDYNCQKLRCCKYEVIAENGDNDDLAFAVADDEGNSLECGDVREKFNQIITKCVKQVLEDWESEYKSYGFCFITSDAYHILDEEELPEECIELDDWGGLDLKSQWHKLFNSEDYMKSIVTDLGWKYDDDGVIYGSGPLT